MREVKVTWIDSSALGEVWLALTEVPSIPVIECETLGFLLYEDEEVVKVAQSINKDCCMNVTVIPKGCIKKIS